MKKKIGSLGLAMLVLAGLTTQLNAQSTAFTYQGRLDQNGQPATGIYKMTFRLFQSNSGGAPLTNFPVSSVPVTNGLFTVDVDFEGARFLTGEAWMDILVATNGSSNYTPLEPRTRLAPAPKAFYANLAGTVTNKSIGLGQLATTGTAGPGKVLGFDGSSLTWQTPSSDVWSVNSGNAYYSNGRVGIGTSDPAAKLHVA